MLDSTQEETSPPEVVRKFFDLDPPNPRDTFKPTVSIVTSKLKISEKEVFSRIKLQKVVRGRHLIWWILHRRFGWSLGRIGLAADRDHTSILHGVRAIDHFAERPGAADWLADLVGEIHLAIEARK